MAALVVVLGSPPALADEADLDGLTPSPTPDPVLLAPTLGRPAFVEPGGVLDVTVGWPGMPDDPRFVLVSDGILPHRHALTPQAQNGDAGEGTVTFELLLAEDIPEKTYDLEISAGQTVLSGRHAVAVARLQNRLRLVHLSDMNVGAIGVPGVDHRLIAEVNLLDPTLIVATGDLVDATHDDPEAGWQQVSEFLASFDAPVLVACGDHDDVSLYSRLMAPSPIGAIDVGAFRGIVLYDLPERPISVDEDQIDWVQRELARGHPRLTFVVSHDESPNLLRHWMSRDMLKRMVWTSRIGLWFSGGHQDWDRLEYRALVDGAEPMLYLRTHQASTATLGGAEGVSHYRVVDVDGDRAVLYGPWMSSTMPHSTPVGRLAATFDVPNDGSARRVAVTVVNGLSFRLKQLATRVLVRKEAGQLPWCLGAQLERVTDIGDVWECKLRFDLPDKGTLRAVVGTGVRPASPQVNVVIDGPSELVFEPVVSEDAVIDFAAEWAGSVRLQNNGGRAVKVMPVVRLDGELIAYKVVGEQGPFASAYHLQLQPGQPVALQLDFTGLRIGSGPHALQVYIKGGPALVPVCWPVDVTVQE